jgi:hypothetical protein
MNHRTATIAGRNYDALVALQMRMSTDDLAWDTINARVEEARQAMKGMPDDMITLGELHTAFRCVYDHGPVSSKRVSSAIQSSTVRAGNALRQLEEAGLVCTSTIGEWVTRRDDIHPEEVNAIFDQAFPGLVTINKTKPNKQPNTNKETTMSTTTTEFTRDNSKVTGTKFEQVVKMIDLLRKSDTPIGFNDLCEKVGAKYPQDVQASMFALESTGAIDRYKYVKEGSTRELIAYKWAGESEGDAPRPTKSTSTASRSRSRKSKTEETPATDKQAEVAAA